MAHGIILEYARCRMSGCECDTDSQTSRVECQTHLGLTSTPLQRKTDYELKSVASPAVAPEIRKLDTAVNYVGTVLHTARPQNLS
ncbi:hypothetical protein T12_5145 [Trichinella patagoniensis]|uniref:Uncharacterized protein n=1 Tax=Trichinella patagoniensis TaxID=990121 RepID=A0A0V0ZPW5_9BILA|nr:hypothetical protein T12_5145 [Trichinella patagoniensis]